MTPFEFGFYLLVAVAAFAGRRRWSATGLVLLGMLLLTWFRWNFGVATVFGILALGIVLAADQRTLGETSRRRVLAWLSLGFAAAGGPGTLLVAGTLLLIHYPLGRRLREQGSAYLLGIGIAVNLLTLAAFRYLPLLLEAAGADSAAHFLNDPRIQPFGLSFLSFTFLAYLMDCHAGAGEFSGFRDYALYHLYFPKFGSGPITRPDEFREAMARSEADSPSLESGLFLLLWGIFQKMVLADRVAETLAPVFSTPDGFSRGALAGAALLYPVQLFLDFSGYTDIARGASRMMGIELPVNFRNPFLARSFTEFWQRWHITLSRWLRDYLFVRLAHLGSGDARRRMIAATMATLMICGLWHGAAATFLLWGTLHGAVLALERITRWPERISGRWEGIPARLVLAIPVYAGLAATFVVFRAGGTAELMGFLAAAVRGGGTGTIALSGLIAAVLAVILMHGAEFAPGLRTAAARAFARCPRMVTYATAAWITLFILFFREEPRAFIYFLF
ncbi:MAG: MBOAT family O-acyltransferase [Planctomycetota bacterium]